MKYDIYFHNDFDGRASAAVMLAFLRSKGDAVGRYVAMTYGNHDSWFKENFFDRGNPAIVLDFTYHPRAAWWFDHHATAFKRASWRKRFRSDIHHRLDARYHSCCRLVYDSLKRDFHWKPPRHLRDLARWLDVIDGARYRSARQTIEMREPALQMNAFIEGFRHPTKEDRRIVELLAREPLARAVRNPMVVRALRALRKGLAESLLFHKKNLRAAKRITFIDLARDPLHGFLRYAPYYFYPKSIYSVRMRPKGRIWYLGVSANPWKLRANRRNIGALMRRYKGGGHQNVGATEFRTKASALAALEEIERTVNR